MKSLAEVDFLGIDFRIFVLAGRQICGHRLLTDVAMVLTIQHVSKIQHQFAGLRGSSLLFPQATKPDVPRQTPIWSCRPVAGRLKLSPRNSTRRLIDEIYFMLILSCFLIELNCTATQ